MKFSGIVDRPRKSQFNSGESFFFHVLEPLSFNCKATFYVEATYFADIQ